LFAHGVPVDIPGPYSPEHTVKIRYTRGFTTEKQGSGKMSTTDIVTADSDRRRLKAGGCFNQRLAP
jgi:hypothetical protein